MASQRGRNSNRNTIDNFLDDLLGSDTEDTGNKKKNSAKKVETKGNLKTQGKEVKLTSSSSDAEFYRNLKSLGGGKVESDVSEDEELSDSALQKVADDIGDLDDLDNDLFAGLSSGKSKPKSTGNKQNQVQKKLPPKYDEDDPLAGLGLSDDEELQPQMSKKFTPVKRPLSRRLSGEKMKIEPSPEGTGNDEVHRSPNTELGKDPFMTSNTQRKLSRTMSIDEPSANESDVSPRTHQEKQRKKSCRKNSIDPTVKHGKSEGNTTEKTELKSAVEKPPAKKVDNDLFDDSDDLPGFSDEEEAPKSKITPKKAQEYDDIPAEKASSALTNLLGGSSHKKTAEPTLLDQIMSGKKVDAKKSNDNFNVLNQST